MFEIILRNTKLNDDIKLRSGCYFQERENIPDILQNLPSEQFSIRKN